MEIENGTLDTDEYANSTFLRRIVGHHLLDSKSYQGMSTVYLIIVPIIVLLILVSLRLAIFASLTNNITFDPSIDDVFKNFKESYYIATPLSSILQVLFWGVIMFGIFRYLGGKGKVGKTLAIYCMSLIPVVLGTAVLFIFASTQPSLLIFSNSTDFVIEGSYRVFTSFNLANNILIPIVYLYSHVIAAVGLSTEHKIPLVIGGLVAGMAYIASMVFYFLV